VSIWLNSRLSQIEYCDV